MAIEMRIRCRAFSGEGVRLNRVRVRDDSDGPTLLVWDSVAGHYVLPHSMTRATQRRLLKRIMTEAAREECRSLDAIDAGAAS